MTKRKPPYFPWEGQSWGLISEKTKVMTLLLVGVPLLRPMPSQPIRLYFKGTSRGPPYFSMAHKILHICPSTRFMEYHKIYQNMSSPWVPDVVRKPHCFSRFSLPETAVSTFESAMAVAIAPRTPGTPGTVRLVALSRDDGAFHQWG